MLMYDRFWSPRTILIQVEDCSAKCREKMDATSGGPREMAYIVGGICSAER